MAKHALLVMDVQRAMVDRFTGDAGYLPRLRERDRGRSGSRHPGDLRGYRFPGRIPGGQPAQQNFRRDPAQRGGSGEGDPQLQVHPEIAPQPGDIVVTKKRVSAFAGSDLDMVLRAGDIDSAWSSPASPPVVWCCPLCARPPTWTSASPSWRTPCLDWDPEVHRVLTEKVFLPMQAEVSTVDEWAAAR